MWCQTVWCAVCHQTVVVRMSVVRLCLCGVKLYGVRLCLCGVKLYGDGCVVSSCVVSECGCVLFKSILILYLDYNVSAFTCRCCVGVCNSRLRRCSSSIRLWALFLCFMLLTSITSVSRVACCSFDGFWCPFTSLIMT